METSVRRVNRSKESARQSYNRLSRWYDLIAGSTEKKYRDWGLEKLSAQPGEKILEIGFGTGHCLVALAKAVWPSGRVIGLDISDGMLAIARERLREQGLSDRVDLHLGDAANLSFIEASSLDGVFMSFTLELFDNPEIPRVLQECHRVLKPGGRVCILEITRPRTRLGRLVLSRYLAWVPAMVGRGSGRTAELWRYYWDTIDRCVPPETILEVLRRNGFVDVGRRSFFGPLHEYLATKASWPRRSMRPTKPAAAARLVEATKAAVMASMSARVISRGTCETLS